MWIRMTYPSSSSQQVHNGIPRRIGRHSLDQILYRIGFGEAVWTGKHGQEKKNIAGSSDLKISNIDQIKTFGDISSGSCDRGEARSAEEVDSKTLPQ
jgi:hypothetical protein